MKGFCFFFWLVLFFLLPHLGNFFFSFKFLLVCFRQLWWRWWQWLGWFIPRQLLKSYFPRNCEQEQNPLGPLFISTRNIVQPVHTRSWLRRFSFFSYYVLYQLHNIMHCFCFFFFFSFFQVVVNIKLFTKHNF